jgi:hypothetical protein
VAAAGAAPCMDHKRRLCRHLVLESSRAAGVPMAGATAAVAWAAGDAAWREPTALPAGEQLCCGTAQSGVS